MAELHTGIEAERVSCGGGDDAGEAAVCVELAGSLGADELERSGGGVRFVAAAFSGDTGDQFSVCADGDRVGEAAGAWDGSECGGDVVCDEAEYEACDCGGRGRGPVRFSAGIFCDDEPGGGAPGWEG